MARLAPVLSLAGIGAGVAREPPLASCDVHRASEAPPSLSGVGQSWIKPRASSRSLVIPHRVRSRISGLMFRPGTNWFVSELCPGVAPPGQPARICTGEANDPYGTDDKNYFSASAGILSFGK